MISLLRAPIAARLQRLGDEAMLDLRRSLDRLGIDRPISGAVESLVRFHSRMNKRWYRGRIAAMVLAFWGYVFIPALVKSGWYTLGEEKALRRLTPEALWKLLTETNSLVMLMYAVGLMLVSWALAWMLIIFVSWGPILAAFLQGSPYARVFSDAFIHERPTSYKSRLPGSIARAIERCATAADTVGEKRIEALRALSKSLEQVVDDLMRADLSRGSIPLRSHRRKAARRHAARVAGRLREVECDLDRAAGPVLVKLGNILLTIAERYADGRLGALLDEDLSGVEPVRSSLGRIWRPAGAVLVMVSAVFAVAALDLPQAIEGYAIAGAGALVLLIFYGPQAILDVRRR
ncbi:hypothetical protein MTF65_03395 [Streptomyces sp. APSN-46.1]|uniref:hypothetical protein n=1 Tax=Streptomyces sp. APSN-46.1 TaxID=2929049 RepID=UPI001FB1BA6D|nr:hypothetical protein [Streptomyces sp. APSN-46.1]MCJ1676410.1 hypothetical protein [Streptomyces sp. APSN-46.1]